MFPIWLDTSPQLSIGKNFDRCQTGGYCKLHMACMTQHVVKHTHHPELEFAYNVILAYVLALLDLRAIHFKFHDRMKHRPIDFKL
jgi:hypothetical protein